jgi:protein gp37
MSATRIEWTAVQAPDGTWIPGYTFNPWWGCQRVSPACENCYAETFDKRLGFAHWGPGAPFRFFGDAHWNEPLKWNSRAAKLGLRLRVFCGSMCDWLQDRPELEVPRARLLKLIDETPHLDWLMLSKRPQNLCTLTPWGIRGAPRNVKLGATAESQEWAGKRVLWLLDTPAPGGYFLSVEPLLGEIDLTRLEVVAPKPPYGPGVWLNALTGHVSGPEDILPSRLHWVIVGSESGTPGKVRATRDEWVASLRDQCAAASVPFFLKQLQDPMTVPGRVVSLPVFQGRQHRGQPGGAP